MHSGWTTPQRTQAVLLPTVAQQPAAMLSRLRAYGPAFEHELIAENGICNPAACAASLCADGYHIEALRRYEPQGSGKGRWVTLYLLRIKRRDTGQVIAAPASVGMGGCLEKWTDASSSPQQ